MREIRTEVFERNRKSAPKELARKSGLAAMARQH